MCVSAAVCLRLCASVCRRAGARLELGMVGAYGHEDDMAKFSQSEVNAMIKER